jgi:hypothetical protein
MPATPCGRAQQRASTASLGSSRTLLAPSTRGVRSAPRTASVPVTGGAQSIECVDDRGVDAGDRGRICTGAILPRRGVACTPRGAWPSALSDTATTSTRSGFRRLITRQGTAASARLCFSVPNVSWLEIRASPTEPSELVSMGISFPSSSSKTAEDHGRGSSRARRRGT